MFMSRQKRLRLKAQKKMSAKKEKYTKFRKDKPAQLDLSFPDLDDEMRKEIRLDETRMNTALRYAFSAARLEEKRREERKPR